MLMERGEEPSVVSLGWQNPASSFPAAVPEMGGGGFGGHVQGSCCFMGGPVQGCTGFPPLQTCNILSFLSLFCQEGILGWFFLRVTNFIHLSLVWLLTMLALCRSPFKLRG